MMKYHSRRRWRNPDQFDLFEDYRERELRSVQRSVRILAKRFGLSVEHAIAIAVANGYGPKDTG